MPAPVDDTGRSRRLSWRTIRAIMRREFTDVVRDRRSLILTFLYPISMLIMYGYGIRYDVDHVPLTILDHDRSPESRGLTEQMLRSDYFHLVRHARDEQELAADLRTDRSRAGVVIPVDFAAHLRVGTPVTVQAIIDGADANSATIAQGYLLAMVGRYAATLPGAGAGARPVIELRGRIWYNPELRSVNFIVPGVIAVIMMIIGVLLTALSIVKEKERGTIEQILVSPIRPLEMIVGKIVPYVLIAVADLGIVVATGYVVFHVPIRGSLGHLALFSVVYLVASLGTGVFVSTLANTTRSAMLMAMFISFLPAVLLSGFVFPLEHMPGPIQALSYAFPGRYFVTAIRGIYLKGAGLAVLWPEALLLLAFGVGIVGLSVRRFADNLG